MRKLPITLAGALCVLAFAAGAWAQSDDLFGEGIDWNEAERNAEMIETFVADGETWEVYLDEVQDLLWAQPAPEFLEDDEALDDLRTVYVSPSLLRFCYNETCTSKTEFTGFTYDMSSTRAVKKWTAFGTGPIYWVDRIRAEGASGGTDYCDDEYDGWYNDLEEGGTFWRNPDTNTCSNYSPYTYVVDETDDITDWTYSSHDVARWEYNIGDDTYFTELKYQYIE